MQDATSSRERANGLDAGARKDEGGGGEKVRERFVNDKKRRGGKDN